MDKKRAVQYIAYIDEAGDPGFGKLRDTFAGVSCRGGQSRWFAIGGIVVGEEADSNLPKLKRAIIQRLQTNKKDLHFVRMQHNQRIVACQEIGKERIGICVVFSNKATLLSHPKLDHFKPKGILYNYLVRYLLERISDTCREAAKRDNIDTYSIKIVFSRCGHIDYNVMRKYFELQRDGKEIIKTPYQVDWSKIDLDEMRVEGHAQWAGLQIADICTSAFYAAFEPNDYGNYETSYALLLKHRLMKKQKSALNHGLTLVPPLNKNPLDELRRQFVSQIVS